MIADEEGKEKIYHLADRIKDGQILKIARNQVVIVRANGQHETFLLRKIEMGMEEPTKDPWEYTVKKIDNQTYQIDIQRFTEQVQTLGELIETLSLSTAYQKGKRVGVRVSQIDKNDVGSAIGLEKNDIITSINDISTTAIKDRIKIYDTIADMKQGDTIKVDVNRNKQNVTLQYELTKIKKAKLQFMQASKNGKDLKKSPLQKKEQKIREFKKFHAIPPEKKEMISNIRKRLLANMKKRKKNRRVR